MSPSTRWRITTVDRNAQLVHSVLLVYLHVYVTQILIFEEINLIIICTFLQISEAKGPQL